jgi:multiple sugar transport system permease protein
MKNHRNVITNAIKLIVGILMILLVVVPFVWMLLVSFQEKYTMYYLESFIPSTIKNYIEAFTIYDGSLLRWMLNSAIVSLFTAGIVIITSMLGGYGFARINFKMRESLFTLYLSTIMIPFATTLIPLLIFFKTLGLTNTYLGLILPFCANIVPTFWIRQYVKNLPKELEDAARIDGCSDFQVFTKIVLHLLKPAIGVVALYTIWNQWNALLWPLVVVQDMSMYTATQALALLQGGTQMATNWGLIMAIAFITGLPMFIMFLAFQKMFIKGMVLGALKG